MQDDESTYSQYNPEKEIFMIKDLLNLVSAPVTPLHHFAKVTPVKVKRHLTNKLDSP